MEQGAMIRHDGLSPGQRATGSSLSHFMAYTVVLLLSITGGWAFSGENTSFMMVAAVPAVDVNAVKSVGNEQTTSCRAKTSNGTGQ
jgi:hypothetical protein